MQQTEDFRAECDCLAKIVADRGEDIFQRPTLFNSWTISDIIGHLHMFNVAARLTLEDDQKFADFFAPVAAGLKQGESMLETQYVWLDGLEGVKLFDAWRNGCQVTADLYARTDPRRRIKWAGPDMSARSSITARQMETWAHGQEIFDCLGVTRPDTDRIKNIAHLGVQTFGWAFINRQLPVPEPAPHVVLTGPSGAVWEWNEPREDNRVSGQAVEFGQVVTQTRNIADTSLVASGDVAERWMAIAQCFAGAPVEPPAAGQRYAASN